MPVCCHQPALRSSPLHHTHAALDLLHDHNSLCLALIHNDLVQVEALQKSLAAAQHTAEVKDAEHRHTLRTLEKQIAQGKAQFEEGLQAAKDQSDDENDAIVLAGKSPGGRQKYLPDYQNGVPCPTDLGPEWNFLDKTKLLPLCPACTYPGSHKAHTNLPNCSDSDPVKAKKKIDEKFFDKQVTQKAEYNKKAQSAIRAARNPDLLKEYFPFCSIVRKSFRP